jgi:hypothetical protein
LWAICPGWHWTLTLLISPSQVIRITGVSRQCLAQQRFFDQLNNNSTGKKSWQKDMNYI